MDFNKVCFSRSLLRKKPRIKLYMLHLFQCRSTTLSFAKINLLHAFLARLSKMPDFIGRWYFPDIQCIAVHCGVLQCIAVQCIAIQFIAVCYLRDCSLPRQVAARGSEPCRGRQSGRGDTAVTLQYCTVTVITVIL